MKLSIANFYNSIISIKKNFLSLEMVRGKLEDAGFTDIVTQKFTVSRYLLMKLCFGFCCCWFVFFCFFSLFAFLVF